MTLKLLLSFSFCLLTRTLLAQRDCVLLLRYTGTFGNLPFKVHKVILPTTDYLQGYLTKDKQLSTIAREVQDSSFSIESISGMSSHFCGDAIVVVEGVFKKFKNQYFIRFLGEDESKQVEIELPVDRIKFLPTLVRGRKGLQIDFGTLQTKNIAQHQISKTKADEQLLCTISY